MTHRERILAAFAHRQPDRVPIDYPPLRGPIDLQIGQGDQWITLSALQLDESQMMFAPPSMQYTQSAQFGDPASSTWPQSH